MASVIANTPLAFVKQSTHQYHPVFIHVLFFEANTPIPNRQCIIQTTHIDSENGSTRNGKLTKALPDLPIFTNRKDSSID